MTGFGHLVVVNFRRLARHLVRLPPETFHPNASTIISVKFLARKKYQGEEELATRKPLLPCTTQPRLCSRAPLATAPKLFVQTAGWLVTKKNYHGSLTQKQTPATASDVTVTVGPDPVARGDYIVLLRNGRELWSAPEIPVAFAKKSMCIEQSDPQHWRLVDPKVNSVVLSPN